MIQIVLALLILTSGLNFAYAEDVLETLRMVHKDNPTVCIFEPEPIIQERFHKDVFHSTADSVLIWGNEMTQYTGGNWYMDIKYYEYEHHADKLPTDYPECNILIVYDKINTGDYSVKETALGFTSFDFSNSGHQYSMILVFLEAFEEIPNINICIGECDFENGVDFEKNPRSLSENAVKKILLHEFGHALSIGHYVDDVEKDNNEYSMMYPSMQPFSENSLEIGQIDKEILKKIYGADGFGGLSGHSPYHYKISELVR
jgi:hypothetical protein